MKRLVVKHVKLGKQKAWGVSDSNGEILIDERLKGKKHLEILIHECLHCIYPELSEEDVIKDSILLCNTLWSQRYRRFDEDSNTPLQDGTK
jgi:hypothetical protein